ncbi:MAG: FlgD immunoglobulin-like domain containing protein, partial [Sphaerochaetaceae bacterium]
VSGSLNVGGLIGNSEGGNNTIENSYWDIVTSYKNISGTNDTGEGLMTVDMVRDNSEYTNWNFYSTWAMVDYTTYPYLKWQDKPGVHNYPINGYYKPFIIKYPSQSCFWESFPVLGQRGISAKELLDPLTKLVDCMCFRSDIQSLVWNKTTWDNVDFDIVPYNGYKLEFLGSFGGDLTVPGEGPFVAVPFNDVELELHVNTENWIGYYVPQPQPVTDAFDSIWPVLKSVTSETWSISRNTPQSPFALPYPPPEVEFGKGYVVTTFADTTFSWNIPTQYITQQYEKRYPEYFSFNDAPDYEVFNIESIDNDQDVIEVGVFAGDTCVGASVFQGYPMQILAYTNPTHSEENLSFIIHRSSRGGDQIVRSVEVKDDENGEFYVETLKPFKQRHATIRLGAGDEIEEKEEVVEPKFALSQNYPNPIVMSQVSRSSELTKIDFSLPEAAEVSLNVYNIKGQLVKTLASGELSAGRHTVSWDGNNVNNQSVGSSVYFYRLDSGKKVINRKMLIIK